MALICPACEAAELDPLGELRAGCDSCQARAIAQIALHRDSMEAQRVLPELAAVLGRLFTDPAAGWKLVRYWGPIVDRARKQQ